MGISSSSSRKSGSVLSGVTPVTPDEAVERQIGSLPPEVVACWNDVIGKAFRDGEAVIYQEDAIKALLSAMGLPNESRQQVFDNGWLDIEPLFRKHGWVVKYDRPGYNETYDANWTFTRLRQRVGGR